MGCAAWFLCVLWWHENAYNEVYWLYCIPPYLLQLLHNSPYNDVLLLCPTCPLFAKNRGSFASHHEANWAFFLEVRKSEHCVEIVGYVKVKGGTSRGGVLAAILGSACRRHRYGILKCTLILGTTKVEGAVVGDMRRWSLRPEFLCFAHGCVVRVCVCLCFSLFYTQHRC